MDGYDSNMILEKYMGTDAKNASVKRLIFDINQSISKKNTMPLPSRGFSIAGFAKLLKKGNLTEEQKEECLEIIEEESLRLAAMATNVNLRVRTEFLSEP